MTARHVGRRDAAAGGLAMLVPAAAAAGSAKAQELDGELFALTREFEETIPTVIRLEDERDALPRNHPGVNVLDAQVKALVSRRWELREAISDTPAVTPEGLIAKAKVALWELSDGDPTEGPTYGSSTVAWSLARDIAGEGGVMDSTSTLHPTDTSDAELIRICAEHIVNHREFNARAGEVPIDEDPRWAAYERTLDAICDSEPKTLAGIVAKARAAQVEATDPEGYEVPESEVPMIWSIVKDLIRLGDEPHPDAELIDACNDFLRIQRAFSAAYEALGGKDMDPNDPAHEMLDPIAELAERIVALRATTADGFLARAQCAAFFILPAHRSCRDNPDAGWEDRFAAALMRDAVRLNGEHGQ